jgi:hypothetical protein
MGPPSYMWSVVDRNVVMRPMPVLSTPCTKYVNLNGRFCNCYVFLSVVLCTLSVLHFYTAGSSCLLCASSPSTFSLPLATSNQSSLQWPEPFVIGSEMLLTSEEFHYFSITIVRLYKNQRHVAHCSSLCICH